MVTKKIVKEQKVNYSGLLNVKELYESINTWLKDHGYDTNEKQAAESVVESGKTYTLVLEPDKKVSDYVQLAMKVECVINNCTDVKVERESYTIGCNKGDVECKVKGTIKTDYDDKWHEEPEKMFIKEVFDKFIFGFEVKAKEKMLVKDVYELARHVKAFLNMYR